MVLVAGLQVLSDLNTAASELGLGPRPLGVAVANAEGGEGGEGGDGDDDDDDDENKEEGEVIMVSVKNGLSGDSVSHSTRSDGQSLHSVR